MPETPTAPPALTPKHKLPVSIDMRVVVGVLLAVIAAMLLIWRPWSSATSEREISVTGEATISAEPDEYQFQPTYQFSQGNQEATLTAMTAKSESVVAGLKDLGVKDSQIKTNANDYGLLVPAREPGAPEANFNLTLTINLPDKELAQEVQDYLLTTTPAGAITPYVTFSDAKRHELEAQARDQATKDARAKAEQSAANLGFTIGDVKTVTDGSGFGVFPYRGGAEPAIAEDSAEDSSMLRLQPGENKITYSVTVVYYLK